NLTGYPPIIPYDCIAEYFSVKSDHGAFAVIMNARYGIGSMDYTTDGPSQRYHREYWDAVFGEGKSQISKANQDSKEDNLYRINEYAMRWCYYQLNLFGDPTIDFFKHINNSPPMAPLIAGEINGKVGESYDYTFVSIDPEDNDIWYYIDWGDKTNTGWIGPYDSGVTITKSHTWSKQRNYTIKAKAKDTYCAESEWGKLEVTMPKNQQVSNMWFLRWLENLPILQRLLEFIWI
ncbi:MAG: hypothetical protein JSW60_08660, partial [Thermoplasmatales archaeon]